MLPPGFPSASSGRALRPCVLRRESASQSGSVQPRRGFPCSSPGFSTRGERPGRGLNWWKLKGLKPISSRAQPAQPLEIRGLSL